MFEITFFFYFLLYNESYIRVHIIYSMSEHKNITQTKKIINLDNN